MQVKVLDIKNGNDEKSKTTSDTIDKVLTDYKQKMHFMRAIIAIQILKIAIEGLEKV